MTYSYYCALNDISMPKKMKYSIDSKMPIDSSTLVKKTVIHNNFTLTNSNIDIYSNINNLKKKKFKRNLISSIVEETNKTKPVEIKQTPYKELISTNQQINFKNEFMARISYKYNFNFWNFKRY